MKHEMDKGPAKTWGTFLKSVFQNVVNTLKWKSRSATLVQIEMPEFVPVPTQQDRPLTEQERSLVKWLLEHGNPDAAEFLPQLADAWVVSRCGCGCASIDFAIGGVLPLSDAGMHILSDYEWKTDDSEFCGAFVFACGGQLAGLEVWSVDGQSSAGSLPRIDQLHPLNGSPTV